MKRLFAVLIILCIAVPAFAGEFSEKLMELPEYKLLETEIQGMVGDNADKTVGSLTLNQVRDIAAQLSVYKQQMDYIKKARMASFFMPGLGQFINGDVGSGILFLLGDLSITAGTILGAYFLLPEAVRFESIDYFNDSYNTIDNAWRSLSFIDVLPSLGVVTGGMIVNGILRYFSARHAAAGALENIREGRVSFEPIPILYLGQAMGLGFRMRF